MKRAIKHNLLILRKMPPSLIVMIFFLTGLFVLEGYGFFIITIPTITFFSIFTMERFDGEKYNTLFSIPVTRAEFAKAKFYTLLIIIGAATLLILVLYFVCVHTGAAESNVLYLILELAITLPLSIFIGGILVGIKIDYISLIAFIYIFVMNFFALNVLNKDIELQIGKDVILDALMLIIWSGLSIASYIGTKRSVINKYIDMEL